MTDEKNTKSRRSFLKGAGLLFGGAAIATSTVLAGCTGPEGEAGTDGAIWYNNSGVPLDTIGVDGDLYLNTDDGSVWKKSNNTWSEIANITGPKGSTGSAGTNAFKLPISVPLSKGVLVVRAEYCAGCEACMYACSLSKEGVASLALARIQLTSYNRYEFDHTAQPCQQCIDPQCVRYCPTGACHVDETTGARVINQSICIGCQECIKHCAYNPPRIIYDAEKKKAAKCDLCGGDPQCVKSCPTGALTYYTDPDGVESGYGAGGI